MQTLTRNNPDLLHTFKSILQQQHFGSQIELAHALSSKGYENVSQAKVSRMLAKVGAIRTRNSKNEMVYHLPDQAITPKNKQSINSLVLGIKHNGMQIILKTIVGGAGVISRMLENMGESLGILGCIADDSTILVIPTDVVNINDITKSIVEHLEISSA